MRALKGRQAALLAIQRDAEHKLAEARSWGNQGTHSLLSDSAVDMTDL